MSRISTIALFRVAFELLSTHLVIVVKVDPATQTLDGTTPLASVAHDDGTTFRVVLLQTKLHHCLFPRDTKLLVNLVLDGQAVGIPAKAALDVEAFHRPVSGNDVFDGRGE